MKDFVGVLKTYQQNKYWRFALTERWAFWQEFAATNRVESLLAFCRTFHSVANGWWCPFTITTFQLTLAKIDLLHNWKRLYHVESNDLLLLGKHLFHLFVDTFHGWQGYLLNWPSIPTISSRFYLDLLFFIINYLSAIKIFIDFHKFFRATFRHFSRAAL